MAHLITGYAGYEHIKSSDAGSFNAAFFGEGQYVMEIGSEFAASILNNNTVRIYSGDGLMFGRHFRIDSNSHEDVTIETGTAGTKRYDLICATYKKNTTDGTEEVYLEVIKGSESSSPKLPTHTTGNILLGATFNQMPLYSVYVSGVELSGVTPLFETCPSIAQKIEQEAEKYAAQYAEKIDAYKKEGTYTGDSKASRNIKLAESGNVVYICDDIAMTFVGIHGGWRKSGTALSAFTASDAKFKDGVLTISSSNGATILNLYGTEYTYQVL